MKKMMTTKTMMTMKGMLMITLKAMERISLKVVRPRKVPMQVIKFRLRLLVIQRKMSMKLLDQLKE